MNRSLIPTVLLVLLTATACGERQAGDGAQEIPAGDAPSLTMPPKPPASQPGEPGDPTTPAITTGPSGVEVPPGYEVLPPEQVDAKSLPGDLYEEQRVWVSDDERTLQLFAMAPSPCTPMEAVVEATDASRVTLALAPMAQRQGGPEDQACATVITPMPVSVSLKEALGDRQVVLTAG